MAIVSEKAGLFLPALGSAIDRGVLEADENGLVFRGKRQPHLVVTDVHRLWTDGFIVHVEFGEGSSLGFADYSHGAFKASSRVKPFAEEIRSLLGLPQEAPASEQQRMDDAARAAIPKAKNKMQLARVWMGLGGAMCVTGLVWVLVSEEVPSFAWFLLIAGVLRFLAGAFDYRDAKRMAAGEWRPMSERRQAQVQKWVLIGAAAMMLLLLWFIAYGIQDGFVEPGLGYVIGGIVAAFAVVYLVGVVLTLRKQAARARECEPDETPATARQIVERDIVEPERSADPLPQPVPEPPREPAPEPTPEPAPEPGAAAEPSRRRPAIHVKTRTLLIALAIVGVLAIAGISFSLGRSSSGDDAKPSGRQQQTTPAEQSEDAAPVESEPQTDLPSDAMPEDVVLALYDAAARGDRQAVRATYAQGFEIPAGMLAEWGEPTCEIETVMAGAKEGDLKIQVREEGGGLSPDGDTVTWTLRGDQGNWRICGWFLGTITEDPSFGTDGSTITPQQSPGQDKAINTLATFLQHRMAGAVGDMKQLSTSQMPKRQPELFEMVQIGDFTAFSITSAREENGAYVIKVRETWRSGDVTHDYLVTQQDGKTLVAEQR